MANEADLLKTVTKNYRPFTAGGTVAAWNSFNANGFSLSDVERMRQDAQVSLCLQFRSTPLFAATHQIESENEEVKKFVQEQLERFWRKSLGICTEAYPYGWSAAEVLYRRKKGKIEFDQLRGIAARDSEIWTRNARRGAVRVTSTAGGPEKISEGEILLPCARRGIPAKGWWWVHNSVRDAWYGVPVLRGSWLPWRLKTLPGGGAIDSLARWFYRHAYRGYTIRHPDEVYQGSAYGSENPVDAQSLTRQMMESLKAGSDIALSSAKADGDYLWKVESYGEVNGNAADMIAYVKEFLDVQIQRGMGIPDGIVTDGPGQGYAGRKIPEDAYYTACENDLNELTEVFDDEVLRPLVILNFGRRNTKYAIKPDPLVPIRQQAAKGGPGGGGAGGDQGNPLAALLGGGGGGGDSGPGGTPGGA